jgi:hypothetical protein
METFRRLMVDEMTRVRNRGHVCKSWHEAYGLIAEEFEEFWDEVKKKTSKRDRLNALQELVQVATLCERVAIDLALIDDFERVEEDTQFIGTVITNHTKVMG